MSDDQQQPVLSDVISALISSLCKGRFIADLEAMRLAMQYEKIDLLKGLPVPRLRFTNVKISMPVILTEIIPGANATHAPISTVVDKTLQTFQRELESAKEWIADGITRHELEQDDGSEQLLTLKFHRELANKISSHTINFPTLFKDDLTKRLKNDLDILATEMHGIVSAPAMIKLAGDSVEKSLDVCLSTVIFLYLKEQSTEENEDTVNSNARAEIDEHLEHKILKELIAKVRFSAEHIMIKTNDKATEIALLVDTQSIKNAGGGPDAVTRLSFNIREEGLEWVTDITEEKEVKRLTPE